MRAEGSGRALRSAVADLSRLDDEDLQSILGELDEPARQKLTGLLHEFQQGEPVSPTTPPLPRELALGEWLTARLSGPEAAAGLAMTPTARQALRRAAQQHGWIEAPAPRPVGLGQSLAARIGWGR